MDNKSEDSDVIIVDSTPMPHSDKKRKHKRSKKRNVILCKQRNREIIMCQTFISHRQRHKTEDVTQSQEIPVSVPQKPIERIVPCCLRRRCNRRTNVTRISHRCTTHARSIHKNNTFSKKRSKVKSKHSSVDTNIYENISSGSLDSDSDVDGLIRSTRKRMRTQCQDWSTPILHVSTPLEIVDSDSTFELNTIHSLETVVIKKVDDICLPIANDLIDSINYSPVLSPISLNNNIKVEANNNDIDNTHYSPSMAIEDLQIDIKPTIYENNNYCQCSPISDDYVPNIKEEI